MSSNVREASLKQIEVENTTTHDYVCGELVFEQGYFGIVMEDLGIAQGEKGHIDINPMQVIETDQIEATDTFAWANSSINEIYFRPGTTAAGKLEDASASGNVAVGTLVTDGAKDANDVIQYKPYPTGGKALTA
jgi:hypothetical protein